MYRILHIPSGTFMHEEIEYEPHKYKFILFETPNKQKANQLINVFCRKWVSSKLYLKEEIDIIHDERGWFDMPYCKKYSKAEFEIMKML